MQGDNPTFYRDFAFNKTLDHGTGPNITFTRTGTATYFDATGTLTTATADVPRFDHDPATGASRGLLIEEARTNSIRNSQAGGAATGTPGTLPTNWGTSVPAGITRQVVATGTVNGLAYIDVKFSGTNTSGVSANFFLAAEPATQIVAANGQTWTASVYLALVGGSFTNVTNDRLQLHERNAGGSSIGNTSVGIATVGATLTRFSATRTFNQATTERTNFQVAGTVADGAAIDLTLRIAAPQLEQGAFPTSYIPTTTAAATRSADSAVVTPISSFYNQSEGTLFAEFSRTTVAKQTYFLGFSDTTSSEQMYLETGGVTPSTQRFQVFDGGVSQALIGNYASATANTVYKMAAKYAADDFAVSQNGAAASTDTSGTLPTVTRMEIGVGQQSAAHIRKIAYWNKRLPNARLQAITA